MRPEHLKGHVNVCGQRTHVAMARLHANSLKVIVCNRADDEASDPLNFEAMTKAASACGMRPVVLPCAAIVASAHPSLWLFSQCPRAHSCLCCTGNRAKSFRHAAMGVVPNANEAPASRLFRRQLDGPVERGLAGIAVVANILNCQLKGRWSATPLTPWIKRFEKTGYKSVFTHH